MPDNPAFLIPGLTDVLVFQQEDSSLRSHKKASRRQQQPGGCELHKHSELIKPLGSSIGLEMQSDAELEKEGF